MRICSRRDSRQIDPSSKEANAYATPGQVGSRLSTLSEGGGYESFEALDAFPIFHLRQYKVSGRSSGVEKDEGRKLIGGVN